jgi:hypothetical protein
MSKSSTKVLLGVAPTRTPRTSDVLWCPSCERLTHAPYGECAESFERVTESKRVHVSDLKRLKRGWKVDAERSDAHYAYVTRTLTRRYKGCQAVLHAGSSAQPMRHGAIPTSADLITAEMLGKVLDSFTKPRDDEGTPHNTTCPQCKRDNSRIHGIYRVTTHSGQSTLEASCVECIGWRVPRRLAFGVPCVAKVVIVFAVDQVGEMWRITPAQETRL